MLNNKAKLNIGRHITIKKDDINKYLREDEKSLLYYLLSLIQAGRIEENKKINSYLVVNTDEPYAKKVLDTILTEEYNKAKEGRIDNMNKVMKDLIFSLFDFD